MQTKPLFCLFIASLLPMLACGMLQPGYTATRTVVAQTTVAASWTDTPTPTVTATFTPTSTATETFTPTPDPTVLPTEITDAKGVSMMLVPAGEFTMGSNRIDDEGPVHQVYLDVFSMDTYEVTNAFYRTCVEAGGCTPPHQTNSYNRSSYYGNSQFDKYPVIYVDWNQAQKYCAWRGASLPTEAQWEKAARSMDERTYPWGEGSDCFRANYFGCGLFETKVGSYERGRSPYGIYDMAGNVFEWVADWYVADYYANSPAFNPLGPKLGQYRVLRGGSYFGGIRSADRNFKVPSYIQSDTGFRCARSAP